MESVKLRITGRFRKPMMTIPMSATVLDLKQEIEAELYVDVEKQILYSEFHQELMDDNDRSIESYYSNHKGQVTDLMLFQKPEYKQMDVTVKFESKEADVTVNEGESVGDLKAKIEQLWGIPSEKIMLTYDDIILAVDDLNMWEYYVGEADVIQVTEI
ncbi:hypothetical protein HS088_TW03G00742 [Tripterygium wilfordii]|uniref:Ubiquitin-like domain-containing protein n=1 Tax=Tripterygium wilfordii TaxID=458696 RepID=A0A7J7DWD1_TRIWF|nr:hypothetical protein HS088_TW03G00742 [Tripterygium wilfordii]